MLKRIIISTKLAVIPVVASTLISAILMPGLLLHVVERTVEVANQTMGWELPYLAPWLFSGLPFLPTHELLGKVHATPTFIEKFIYYPVYIIFLILITLYILFKIRNKDIFTVQKSIFNHVISNDNIKNIIIISFTYLILLIIYYISYLLFGNIYRIWKFATYTVLPLSFLPTSLVLLVLSLPLDGNRSRAVAPVATFWAGLVFLGGFWLLPPLVQLPIKFYSVYSAAPFFSEIYRIKSILEKYKTVIIDVKEYSKYFILVSLLNNYQINRFYYTNSIYFVYGTGDYFKLINDNSILISTFNYKDIYNGSIIEDTHRSLYIYDNLKLQELGYASLNNLYNIYMFKFKKQLSIKLRIPNRYKNINLLNEINLDIVAGPVEICRKVQIGYRDQFENIQLYLKDIDDLNIKIDFIAAEKMIINIYLLTPQYNGCQYSVKNITLSPL